MSKTELRTSYPTKEAAGRDGWMSQRHFRQSYRGYEIRVADVSKASGGYNQAWGYDYALIVEEPVTMPSGRPEFFPLKTWDRFTTRHFARSHSVWIDDATNKLGGKGAVVVRFREAEWDAGLAAARKAIDEAIAAKEQVGDASLTWQVIEDNAGGLYLVVKEGDRVIYFANEYEHNVDGLRSDLKALRNGQDPRTAGWEFPEWIEDPQAAYDELARHEYGWSVVADQDGVYPERMGAAAQMVFGERVDADV